MLRRKVVILSDGTVMILRLRLAARIELAAKWCCVWLRTEAQCGVFRVYRDATRVGHQWVYADNLGPIYYCQTRDAAVAHFRRCAEGSHDR